MKMFCKKKDNVKKILSLISCNNTTKIKSLISEHPELLANDLFNDKTILQFICCYDDIKMTSIDIQTIDLLIKLGADPGKSNTNENNWKPIHYATFHMNLTAIKVLLQRLNLNQLKSIVYCPAYLTYRCEWIEDKIPGSFSNNALHILLKYGNRAKQQQFDEILQMLVDNGVDLDQTDSNGTTPRQLIQQLHLNSLIFPQPPMLKMTNFRASARDSVNLMNFAPESSTRSNFGYLSQDSDDSEDLQINRDEINGFDGPDEFNSSCTQLQLACYKGMKNIVEYLLKSGADPNFTIPGNRDLPILLAIRKDHEDIVKLLISQPTIQLPKNILVILQKRNRFKANIAKTNKYSTIILAYIKLNCTKFEQLDFLNAVDNMQRTALHLATYSGNEELTKILLEMGASLTRKDLFGSTPLDFLEPIIFNDFLDTCIDLPENDDEYDGMLSMLSVEKRNFELEIKFNNFIDYYYNYRNNIDNNRIEYPESEFLSCLIKIKKLRPSLNHPVISSYLTVKWQRFRWFCFFDLIFYLFAYFSLLFYGFGYYKLQTVSNSFLIFSVVLLACKEFVQVRIFKLLYIDNLVDLLLICGLIFICYTNFQNSLSHRNTLVTLSLIFLLATVELFLQLSNISIFTIQVIILRAITVNFCKYMLFYSFPLLAFTFCFLMLDEDKQDVFKTIYKSIVMFAGDPDADYPSNFESNPIFGHCIYVVFIIFIGIILQNLLVGLAVSDLQEIRREAEYIEKKERAMYITKIERVLFSWYKLDSCLSMVVRILDKCSLFKGPPLLIIQPYNYGCVYTEDNRQQKSYIRDPDLINNLQQIFKNISVKSDSQLLEEIYEKVEFLEEKFK